MKPEYWFIADIVGNTISADLLAYIKRDVEYTGIEKRHGGYRIFNYLQIKRDEEGRNRLAIKLVKAGFRIDVFSAILDVLDVRYALMERVVFHHGKCIASAMLAKALRLINLNTAKELYWMGDEQFLKYIAETAKSKNIKKEDSDAAQHLIDRLTSRIFYKRIYKVTLGERIEYDKSHKDDYCSQFRNSKSSTDFEEEIEKQFNLPKGSIIIFCPKKNMHLKEAKVMVDWGKSYVYPLNHNNFKDEYPKFWDRVNQIEEKYKDLWSFYISIDPDEFGKTALIQKYIRERFEVKNDPLLDLYLQEKESYKLSKKYELIASDRLNKIKTNGFDGLLKAAAWGGQQESWEKESDMAVDNAMNKHLSEQNIAENKNSKKESVPKRRTMPLFPEENK